MGDEKPVLGVCSRWWRVFTVAVCVFTVVACVFTVVAGVTGLTTVLKPAIRLQHPSPSCPPPAWAPVPPCAFPELLLPSLRHTRHSHCSSILFSMSDYFIPVSPNKISKTMHKAYVLSLFGSPWSLALWHLLTAA